MLPPQSGRRMERNAARWAGYRLSEWQQESTVNRAQVVADYIENNLREAYVSEKTLGKKSKDTPQGHEDMLHNFKFNV